MFSVRLLNEEDEPEGFGMQDTIFVKCLQQLLQTKEPPIASALEELLAFLKRIAEWGIRTPSGRNRTQWFRFENKVSAIPPPPATQRGELRGTLAFCGTTGLRIYCLPLYQSDALILFSGGLKTTRTVQQDPELKRHFDLANKLADVIEREWRANDFDIDSLEGELIPY
ncbi:MAG: hypothetical protein D6794_05485 [Deltaproteobacteria bacterium]|nr:MAG: hypothetical protein D6794_05485 [Deltaproteobacteria bacterium]